MGGPTVSPNSQLLPYFFVWAPLNIYAYMQRASHLKPPASGHAGQKVKVKKQQ